MERLLEDAGKLANTKFDISNYGDVIQAIHTIQENLGITGTTAKEAADTIEGSLNSTKAAFENLMVGFARSDADLDKLMGDVEKNISNLAKNVIPVAERAFVSMSKMAIEAGVKIAKELPVLIEKTMGEVRRMIADNFGDSADKIFAVESALKAAAAGFVAFKAAVYVTDIVDKIRAVNAAMKGTVTLTEALKAANLANPYVLAATAIAAATVALKSYIDTQTDLIQETSDSYDLLNDRQKELVDGIHETSREISESREEWGKTTKTLEDSSALYKRLTSELYSLDEAETLSATGKERMKLIVGQLNSEIDGLNIQLDEENGKLITQKSTIDALIASYEKQAKAKAYQERIYEITKQQLDVEKNLNKATREREGAYNTLSKAQLEYASTQRKINEFFEQHTHDHNIWSKETKEEYDELYHKSKNLEQVISDQADVVSKLNAEWVTQRRLNRENKAEIEEYTASLAGMGEQAKRTVGNLTESTEEVAATTQKQAEKVIKLIEDIAEAYDKALENRTGTFEKWAAKGLEVDNSEAVKAAENTAKQAAEALKKQLTAEIEQSNDTIQNGLKQMDSIMDDYYSEVQNRVSTLNSWVDKNINVDVNADGEITFEDMDNALNETRYKLNEWSKDIAELSKRGISEGLLQQLEEAGPESEEKVKALLSASQEELKRYSENWEKAYSQIPDVAMEQLEKLKSETEQQVSELTNSLIAQSPEFRNALANVGFEAGQGYISALRGQTDEISQVVQEMFNTTKEQIAAQTQSESIIDPSLTLSDLQTALDNTQKGFEEWANNIDELSKRGISQGLLQELEEAGPESADKVKALLSATDPELKKYSKAWEQLHKDIKSTAETQLDGLRKASEKEIKSLIENLEGSSAEFKGAMETVGVNVVDGYLDGIRSKLDEVKEVMKELYNEGTQGTVEDEAEISSPSKAMRRIGKYIGEGFALGIADEKNDVMSASKLLTENAISPMDNLTPVVTKGSEKSAYSGAENVTGAQQQQYVLNLVTPDGNLVGRWIAPFVDAVQGQMMAFSTEGYAT